MKHLKGDTFAERRQTSIEAKKQLLERIKSAPKPDQAELDRRQAERAATALAREAREAERQRAKQAEAERLQAEKEAETARLQAEEAERKAERDQRYSARKARQR